MFFICKNESKLTIEISDFHFHFNRFYYKILSNNNQLLRKGSFNGPKVEIDLRLLSNTLFDVSLSKDDKEYERFSV